MCKEMFNTFCTYKFVSICIQSSLSLSLSLGGELFSKPRAGGFELRSANCAQISVIGYALRLEFVTDR